jgi:MYXO-CTERM domain-containing protein
VSGAKLASCTALFELISRRRLTLREDCGALRALAHRPIVRLNAGGQFYLTKAGSPAPLEEIDMNKLKTFSFATVIALGSTWAVAQQSTSDSSAQGTTQSSARDNDTDWGWVGLLGLAGLLGLKRKERDVSVRTANRTV